MKFLLRYRTILTVGVLLLAMTAGLHAQSPIENAVNRIFQMFTNIVPYLAGLAFMVGGILMAIGHHDAYPRMMNICFGVAISLGAIALVNLFR